MKAWLSAPVIALFASFCLFGALGIAGVEPWSGWPHPLRWALCVMFLLTASARVGPRRPGLVAMVPPGLPRPGLLVNVTGVLEVLGAIGLLWDRTASAAAICLAALMVVMFSANVHAARAQVGLGQRAATPLPIRTVQQVVFIAAAVVAAF
jgi:uncharacterized membrane protein